MKSLITKILGYLKSIFSAPVIVDLPAIKCKSNLNCTHNNSSSLKPKSKKKNTKKKLLKG